jgi:uncharacterized membrane protein YqhA
MRQIIALIEYVLWKARYIMLFPIFFVLLTLIYMVVLIAVRFWDAVVLFDQAHSNPFMILSHLIDVIDFALLCVIALIIVWWLYEIFLNRLEIQSKDQVQADQLLIHDIDELKQKLGKVIVISLVVHIFKHMILFEVHGAIDLLIMGAVVLFLATALFLVERLGSHSALRKHIDACDDAMQHMKDHQHHS